MDQASFTHGWEYRMRGWLGDKRGDNELSLQLVDFSMPVGFQSRIAWIQEIIRIHPSI